MMAYSDHQWNNNIRSPGFTAPPTFPGRPTFIRGNGNMHMQNPPPPQQSGPRPPPQQRGPPPPQQRGPPPSQQRGPPPPQQRGPPPPQQRGPPPPQQRGPPLPQQQFQSYPNMPEPPLTSRNSLYVPRHAQFNNPPPPIPPAAMTLSDPSGYQSFSVPPPNHGVRIEHPPLSTVNAQHSVQNQNAHMKYGPPSLPMHPSFQPRPTPPPFLYNLPHNVPVDHLQSSGIGYKTVVQQIGINNGQVETSFGMQQLDVKEIGTQILDKWLHKVGRSKRPHLKDSSNPKPSEQLWKSMNQLRALTQLIQSMSDNVKEMASSASSASVSTWKTMTSNLETLKDEFCHLEPSLEGPSVSSIEKKLVEIRHKRARLRRGRVYKFEEDQRLKESWMEKSQQIDKWQERHRAKIKEEVMRKSRKAAADCTLSKVSREIQDASRLIDTMLALQKLRLIRRDAAQKRGDTDLGESRQMFDQKIDDMTRLVQSQLDCYKEEEAKLKQVIKSEQDEDTEKERLLQMERQKHKQKEENEEIQTMLFGPMDSITESDPLFPYAQFYKQAENSLQSFVQIRHEWDSFLVPENTPTSSVIPSTWILPELPSSAAWASALK